MIDRSEIDLSKVRPYCVSVGAFTLPRLMIMIPTLLFYLNLLLRIVHEV